jgi:hypothetical protein
VDKCNRCGEVNPAEIHTCTPQSSWQGLTDEEILAFVVHKEDRSLLRFARAIEEALKEKNS